MSPPTHLSHNQSNQPVASKSQHRSVFPATSPKSPPTASRPTVTTSQHGHDMKSPETPSNYDYHDRVEIITPNSASVRELKSKLWDNKESLQTKPLDPEIATKSQHRFDEVSYDRVGLNQRWRQWHQQNQEKSGVNGVRVSEEEDSRMRSARSLSPGATRRNRDSAANVISHFAMTPTASSRSAVARSDVGVGDVNRSYSRESSAYAVPSKAQSTASTSAMMVTSKLFNSRFYQAAQRGLASPDRSQGSSADRGTISSGRMGDDRTRDTTLRSSLSDRPPPAQSSHGLHLHQLAAASHHHTLRANSSQVGSTASRGTDFSDIATLVAKLSAVSRDDPEDALAQIDMILQTAESHSSMGASAEDRTPVNRGASWASPHSASREHQPVQDEEEEDGEDSGDDDETSVSSITNPTYGVVKQDGVEKVPVFSKSNTRPNALQSYSYKQTITPQSGQVPTPNHSADYLKKKARSSRASRRDRSPPPASISVSSSKGSKEKKEQAKQGIGTRSSPDMNQSGMEDSVHPPESVRAPAKGSSDSGPRTVRDTLDWKVRSQHPVPSEAYPCSDGIADSELIKAVDKFLTPVPDAIDATNSADLEEKIRRWDAMSGDGVLNMCPGSEEHAKPSGLLSSDSRDLTPGRRRPHPWDASIPASMGNVDVKDTSMDNANGVETRYSPKYENAEPDHPTIKLREPRTKGERRAAADDSGDGATPLSRSEDTRMTPKGAAPVDFSGDKFDVNPKLLDEQVLRRTKLSSERKELTKTLADDFDSAWVSLPSSSYFPSKESSETKKNHDVDFPESQLSLVSVGGEGTRGKAGRAEEVQKFSPQAGGPSRSQLNYQPPALDERMGRGKLVYDDSKVTEPNAISATNTATEDEEEGQIEVTLVSCPVGEVESEKQASSKQRRGIRSLLSRRQAGKTLSENKSTSTSSATVRSSRSIDYESVEHERSRPSGRSRHTRDSRSPNRNRAHSLEERRIRNPNIAKKFSRLLRVYDEPEKHQQVGYI